LGTGTVYTKHRKYRLFSEAREFVHSLKLKSSSESRLYCKSGKKPHNIPYTPSRVYGDKWRGMGDWLGTNYIAPKHRLYRPFDESKAFVHGLKLKSQSEWRKYCSSGKKPEDIPSNPDTDSIYKKYWKNWGDWLGTSRIADQYKSYKNFEEATKFVHALKLKNRNEWME
jgi:hypothetical protein